MSAPEELDNLLSTIFGNAENVARIERMAKRARRAAKPKDDDGKDDRLEKLRELLRSAMPDPPQPSNAYPLADDIGNTFMELSRLRALAWAAGQVAQQCADATIDTDEKLNRSWLLFELLEQRLSQLTWFVDEDREGGTK